MDPSLLNQTPLFNLSRCDFFGLAIKPDNQEWAKFFDDFLLFQYYSFRNSHVNNNVEAMSYFLHLLEGKFIVFKSDVVLNLIQKMKEHLNKNEIREVDKEYVNFVNVSRVIYVYIIQFLCDQGIKLNMDKITKFLKSDSEIDRNEPEICDFFVRYDIIKRNIDTHKRIDIPSMLKLFPSKNNNGCIIF